MYKVCATLLNLNIFGEMLDAREEEGESSEILEKEQEKDGEMGTWRKTIVQKYWSFGRIERKEIGGRIKREEGEISEE